MSPTSLLTSENDPQKLDTRGVTHVSQVSQNPGAGGAQGNTLDSRASPPHAYPERMRPLELDDAERTCPECGADCEVELAAEDGHGVRATLVCPEHGPQKAIDPFDHLR